MNSLANLITLERRGLASPMRAPRNAGVNAMRVAIVQDDPSQAELLSHSLRRGGHESHHFDRGATVIHALSQNSFDVLGCSTEPARHQWRGGAQTHPWQPPVVPARLVRPRAWKLLSRRQVCERVWGRSAVVPSRTLDTHVSRVRRKLGFMPENGWRLAAKHGYGYRLQQLGAAPSVSSAALA